ncbi:unnamed protein product [Linum trigynum]|uniref:HhH-GPD domain-containing protein n=1 Tax=Linum trigynum TaxID=586398 RepID=A0AAV2E213_9ROSI
MGSEELRIQVPSGFELDKAVCNHGFFMMAPNQWVPSTKTLQRPLRLANSQTTVSASISMAAPDFKFLVVRVANGGELSQPDREAVLAQVRRMLRLKPEDETAVRQFQNLCPDAGQTGFGRLFRSPSLFEDAVKCILLCNCRWKRSLDMAEALCQLQPELITRGSAGARKRKRNNNGKVAVVARPPPANFPNARELAGLEAGDLAKRCNLGLRAAYIVNLATEVATGKLILDDDMVEQVCKASMDEESSFYNKMLNFYGFGKFSVANLMMCIGLYSYLPVDSETVRLVQKKRRIGCHKREVRVAYEQYAPFQSLAYWSDLFEDYEETLGKLSELPKSEYGRVTGTSPNKGEMKEQPRGRVVSSQKRRRGSRRARRL